MKAIIIEDETLMAADLKAKLESLGRNIKVIAVISSVMEGIEWFSSHEEPDIVFSDIRLGDGQSFEIFRKIRLECPVVFTTAYDEYAIEAFRFNSIHYLLKPVRKDDLKEAVDKFEAIGRQSDLSALINQMLNRSEEPQTSFSTRLFIRRGEDIVPIDVDDISGINTEERVSTMYLKDGRNMVIDQSLKDLETMLNPTMFRRISRQWIV
ncbi:MAG: LytTR family DNA-binding domain-containing protein, partial [Bacteroidales bacterium]|nr:LytTR family DNA-binding domain-containing protein [Bacteroidales bacterium]